MSDLHIPTPCHEAWDGMTPTANGRHCATCNHVVVDIASMPVAEGRRVLRDVAHALADPGKRTCVRAHATPAGRLVPGRRKLLTTALAGILACTFAGCVGGGPDLVHPQPGSAQPNVVQVGMVGAPKPGDQALKGEICVVPPVVAPVPVKPPDQPPLTGAPKPRPTPVDDVVVGTIQVDDAPRPPPIEPEIIKGKVAPTRK